MAKKSWYAWRDADGNGGVCKTWDECQQACSGKHNEKHQGFKTYEEAWAFAYPGQPIPAQQSTQPTAISATAANIISDTTPPWETEDTPAQPVLSVKPEVQANIVQEEAQTETLFSPIKLDYSRAEKTPPTEQVNEFCIKYQFNKLSTDQKRAVQAVNGKYLLFAVPGSGKTTVLMARTGYLIHSCGIRPDRLMTMTFTRASAKEMRDRYCKYFKPEDDKIPDFRTIHSFCFSIVIPLLRRAGFRCPFHVINEDVKEKSEKKKYTQRVILTNVLKKHIGANNASDETAQDTVQTAFSSIKNREMTEIEYSRYCVKIDKVKYPLGPMYKDYQEYLRKLDCMDFDDMLIYALKGLRQCPWVLKRLQETYRYWSIDEAQDNSKVQHELMDLLAGPHGNLFMVGDDDQSIYGFRGAEPSMLLRFGNRPDVHLLVMGTNYRSDYNIVRTAKPFVEVNQCRADKNMNAHRNKPGKLRIPPSFPTEAQQYDYIIQAANEAIQSKTKLGILYQLNISALPLIVRMHKAGIPFEASKGLSELIHKKATGNILQLLQLSQQPCSLEKFRECRKTLGLYWLTDELMGQLKEVHARYKQKPLLKIISDSFEGENERSRSVARIHEVIQAICDLTPSEAVIRILKSPDLAPPRDILTDRLTQYALLSICDLYNTIPEMLQALSDMEKAEKEKDQDTPEEEKLEEDHTVVTDEKPFITLSTIHSAKGREWDRVILIDTFQETFPGEPQLDRIGYDPEEARRVFYVAVTRAIHRLEVLTVGLWHGNTEKVSRFIPEYAWIADQKAEEEYSPKNWPVASEAGNSEYVIEPNVFYGVPVGRIPGVYTDYKKVEEQINGFSIPANKRQKKFFTYEEAWEYTFPGQPLPAKEEPLITDSISKTIQLSGGATFNRAIDLPDKIRSAILEHLGVRTLKDLPQERIARLKSECDMFSSGTQADYHRHTDGYTIVYMPVNFHKIWLPLWNLLSAEKLPQNAHILELGPGPGTATWSLIEFYKLLSQDNPNRHFSLLYTAVEREPDFQRIFNLIREKVCDELPSNLSISINLIIGTDAFGYLSGRNENDLDLILESNMLNEAEHTSDTEIQIYLAGLQQNLKPGGYGIFIEPGQNHVVDFLNSTAQTAELKYMCAPLEDAAKDAVCLSENTLVRQAIETGLRYKRDMKHWFSHLILERGGDTI